MSTRLLINRIKDVLNVNPPSRAIFKSLVEYFETLDSGQQQSLDLGLKPTLKGFTNTELKNELAEREKKILKYPILLDNYLKGFNTLKLSYTGIKSKYSMNNKAIKTAWIKFVDSSSREQVEENLRVMIATAMYGLCNDDWHKEQNYKHITPDFLLRWDKLEKWYEVGSVLYKKGKTHNLDLNKEKRVTNN